MSSSQAYPQRQESSGSYRIRPNTHKEFLHYNCQGVYDKNAYFLLNGICSDCQNLYRGHRSVLHECKSNCFLSSMFPSCVSALAMDEGKDDYKRLIKLINGSIDSKENIMD
ncbi:hypothetical protein Pmani_002201 [Petrolisthes manimaculis]|uniref:Uncharacterized protein n=1 Tax=Petrolisthes manimaculis TaxID=1843537 RepID=A0AAE1QKU3_9EUCA|nr:hypothetical protein Pmani_002201 [Petrolisthes manimaculis]